MTLQKRQQRTVALMTIGLAWCNTCGAALPVEAFQKNKANKNGLQGRCREHQNQLVAAGYARDPEKHRAKRRQYSRDKPHVGWEAFYRQRCRWFNREPVVKSFTKEELIEAYGDACWYRQSPDCTGQFEELEHLYPVFAGGEHSLEYCRPACSPCNQRKRSELDEMIRRNWLKIHELDEEAAALEYAIQADSEGVWI